MAIVKNLASVMTTASITSSATSIPVNRTNVFGASQNPLDNPFYVTIMPASGSEPANLTNSEIVLVTGISGSNLIVTRAARTTTARAFTAGAIVTNGIYAEDAVLLGEAGTAVNPQPWVRPADIVWSELVNKIYPVGSIYISTTMPDPADVGALLGGTWVPFGQGRVIVGVDEEDDDFSISYLTGGEKEHTLTKNEMPVHGHEVYGRTGSTAAGSNCYQGRNWNGTSVTTVTGNQGGGLAHNNLQPYITAYMYERIA